MPDRSGEYSLGVIAEMVDDQPSASRVWLPVVGFSLTGAVAGALTAVGRDVHTMALHSCVGEVIGAGVGTCAALALALGNTRSWITGLVAMPSRWIWAARRDRSGEGHQRDETSERASENAHVKVIDEVDVPEDLPSLAKRLGVTEDRVVLIHRREAVPGYRRTLAMISEMTDKPVVVLCVPDGLGAAQGELVSGLAHAAALDRRQAAIIQIRSDEHVNDHHITGEQVGEAVAGMRDQADLVLLDAPTVDHELITPLAEVADVALVESASDAGDDLAKLMVKKFAKKTRRHDLPIAVVVIQDL